MSPPGRGKRSRQAGGLRVSDRKNLTPAEILVVADLLVSNDSISYFLPNRQLIYKTWIPFSTPQPADYSHSVETSVMAALDSVLNVLKKGKQACPLLSRFAYIRLSWLLDALKAAATTDRVQRKVRRDVGHGDATVAINMYLRIKGKVSGKTLTRSEISRYYRTGRRWRVLAGRSPLLVLIFAQIAGTIVYVFLHPSPDRDSQFRKAESLHHRIDSPSSSSSVRE